MPRAGTIYVDVKGDFAPLNRQLREQQVKLGRSFDGLGGNANTTFTRVNRVQKKVIEDQGNFGAAVDSTSKAIGRLNDKLATEALEGDRLSAEGKLTLDSSGFDRVLKEGRSKLDALERKKAKAVLDLDVDGVHEAEVEIEAVRSRVDHLKANISVDVDQRPLSVFGRSLGVTEAKVGKFNASMLTLRNMVNLVKWPALIAGAGLAAQALAALGAGAVAVTGALAPLSGALVAYPGLLGAIGQAAGVVALAGIKDLTAAMGGNEEAMKRLTPEAREFVDVLKTFKPSFAALRRDAQRPLFAGLTDGLTSALKNFPALRSVVRGTAGALGDLAARVGQLLGSKGFGRDFQTIGARNVQTISRLGRAGINLASALRHVMVAAGPLVGFMTKTALAGSRLAETFAKQGRESGKLAGFFRLTRDVLKDLGAITQSVAAGLLAIGSAGAPLGRTILKDLVQVAQAFENWSESLRGQNQLSEFFARAKGPLYETVGLIADLSKAFLQLGVAPGVQDLIKQTRTLVPVLKDVIDSTTQAFGPALIETLRSVLVLVGDLAGSSGPLTVYVRTLGFMADVLHTLLTEVPGLRGLVVALVGLAAVSKSLQFAAAITGTKALATSLFTLKAATVAAWAEQAKWVAGLALQQAALLRAAVATRIMTAAQVALNVATLASPYVAAAAAIAVAAFVIVKNWNKIKHAAEEATDFVKDHPYVLPFGPFVVAAVAIAARWKSLKNAAADTFGALKSAFAAVSGAAQRMVGPVVGALSSIVSALRRPNAVADKLGGAFRLLRRVAEGSFGGIRSAIQWVIDKVNALVGLIPKIKFPKIPNPKDLFGFGAKGGVVGRSPNLPTSLAVVGEEGPEFVRLPVGSRVFSHPESKRMAKKHGIQAFAKGGLVKRRKDDEDFLPSTKPAKGSQGEPSSGGLGGLTAPQIYGHLPLPKRKPRKDALRGGARASASLVGSVWSKMRPHLPKKHIFKPGFRITEDPEGDGQQTTSGAPSQNLPRATRGQIWFPRWAWNHIFGADPDYADWAKSAVVHEHVHGVQSLDTLKQRATAEGGAVLFTDKFQRSIIGSNWYPRGQYRSWATQMAERGNEWYLDDQFKPDPPGAGLYDPSQKKTWGKKGKKQGVPSAKAGAEKKKAKPPRKGDWPEKHEAGKRDDPKLRAKAKLGKAAAMMQRANRLERAGLPYVYGGNHGLPYSLKEGFDCSSAVSYVLGIPPRDAAGLAGYGSPGGGAVSIFARGGGKGTAHAFMSLFGRGFGTSPSNTGRGPGWLDYNSRSGFTVSHLAGISAADEKAAKRGKAKLPKHLSLGQYVTLAKEAKFRDPALAAAVFYAESRGNIHAVGDGGTSFGPAQIHWPDHKKYDKDKLQDDARYNFKAAAEISGRGKDFTPWTMFNNKHYKDFLGGKAQKLPKGQPVQQGTKYSDVIQFKLDMAEWKHNVRGQLKWITEGLHYWRGVLRRNKGAGNTRASDALTHIKDLVDQRKLLRKTPGKTAYDLTELGESIGKGGAQFSVQNLQGVLDSIERESALASLTETFDAAGNVVPSSFGDDLGAAGKLSDLWQYLSGLTMGTHSLPGKGRWEPADPRIVPVDKRGNPTTVNNAVRWKYPDGTVSKKQPALVSVPGTPIPIVGTPKQQTYAAVQLKQSRDALKSIQDEAKSEAVSADSTAITDATSGFEQFKNFSDALRDLARAFGSNFLKIGAPLQAFAKGGTFRQPLALVGEEGPEIVRLPVGTRVFSNPESQQMVKNMGLQSFASGGVITAPGVHRSDDNERLVRKLEVVLKKQAEEPQVVNKTINQTNNYPTPPPQPHRFSYDTLADLKALG